MENKNRRTINHKESNMLFLCRMILYIAVFGLIVLTVMIFYVFSTDTDLFHPKYRRDHPKYFTPEELSQYDGRDESKVYLSVNKKVYDVTSGNQKN